MNLLKRRAALLVGVLATLLSGCANRGRTVPSASALVAAKQRTPLSTSSSLPVLAQPAGSSLGLPVPPDQQPIVRQAAAVKYPNNSGKPTSAFVGVDRIPHILQLDRSNTVFHLENIQAKRWAESPAATGSLELLSVDPNREVYQVDTTFNKTYMHKGNVWSSGSKTFVVDAETGDILWSRTGGSLVQSAASVRHRLAHHVKL